MTVVDQYKRVVVTPGKHGNGDYRVTFGGAAPTHGELMTMLWWILEAEDRYAHGLGRRLPWVLIKEAYYKNGLPLDAIRRNADGEREVSA